MGEEKEYLVRGALLSCDFGSHPRRLNLLKSHGIYIKDHPMIMDSDCIVDENITYFGVCSSPGCTKEGGQITLAGYCPKGSKQAAPPATGYKCQPKLLGGWQCVKGNAVTSDSYLICACGGLISPVSSGQEFED